MFHTYPELGTVTIILETCGEFDYCRKATQKLASLCKSYFGAAHVRLEWKGSMPLTLSQK